MGADFFGFERSSYEVVEGDGEIEVCVISKGPPVLHSLSVTMATVVSVGHQGTIKIVFSWHKY